MTFVLGTWPLTAWTYEGSHIISINQVWFKSDFQLFKWAIFTFSAYLTTWPQMTFDLDKWHLTSSTNDGSHVATMTQLWLKSIKVCGRQPNVNPFFHNRQQPKSSNRQQQGTKWSVCVFPAKADDTIRQATQKQSVIQCNALKLKLLGKLN